MKKDLLGIADLSSDEIYRVLDTAEAMREIGERPIKKVPALRGKTIVNLFFEASTRTRISFEFAEKRLSADTVNVAASGSSGLRSSVAVWRASPGATGCGTAAAGGSNPHGSLPTHRRRSWRSRPQPATARTRCGFPCPTAS